MYIQEIKAIRVFDSRGIPTIKTFVKTDNCVSAAIVPSGTSAGKNEAIELRDKGKKYLGYDVSTAIKNVNGLINKNLKGLSVLDQDKIDSILLKLDGTKNKSKLGANAILSVSLACCRSACNELEIPLFEYISNIYSYKYPKNKNSKKKILKFNMPIPQLNIINGGEHAGSKLAFQEFQIIPNFKDFNKTMQASSEIYLTLKNIIKKEFGPSSINVGYEGGFTPNIDDPEIALELIQKAIKKCKYSRNVSIGLDCAANNFYKNKKYIINNNLILDYKELSKYYLKLIKKYNVTSIEDPFDETHKVAWKYFYKLVGKKINLIGDDLLVTNPKLIKKAIIENYCNSLLLKVNQIGTLSETLEAFNLAKNAGWKVQVSHRSGESEDTFIADLAYGLKSDSVKFGAPARSERTAKYNRLLEINEFCK